MSEPSKTDDAASTEGETEDSSESPASGVNSNEEEVHRVDTVPPPESGDAYSADTVIRDVPREALDAIRDRKNASEKRRASAPVTTEEPVVAEQKKAEAPSAESEPVTPEKKMSPAATETTKPRATAPIAVHAPPSKGPPPVSSSELLIAFVAALALIVTGFYVISSAF